MNNSKFGRKKAPRELMLRNLATSLLLYEKIKTTAARAKRVKSIVEKLLSQAKANNLSSRRKMLAYLLDKNATKKIFDVYLPRYNKIKTGFIKSYHLAPRLGDGSKMMQLNLVEGEKIVKAEDSAKKDKKSIK